MKYLDISVIIPYYRSSETIQRTIKSILNQTKLPKKIYIVNDYSNQDIDKNVLKKLSMHYLIEVINLEKNSGPGVARNIAMNEATTKYIAFLDSDDSWHEKKLERQYKVMEKYNSVISTHFSEVFNENKPIATYETETESEVVEITKYQQLFKNRFSTRSVMLRNHNAIRFSNKRRSEDYLLWSEILLQGNRALKMNEILSYSYKNHYGESGLTKSLIKMYLGGVHADFILYRKRYISIFLFSALLIHKSIKFILRTIKSNFMRRC